MSIERLINHHPKYLSNTNKISSGLLSNSNLVSTLPASNTSSLLLENNNLTSTATKQPTTIVHPPPSSTTPLLTPNFNCSTDNHHHQHHQIINIKNEIKLRFLNPDDVTELKTLCSEWFPVDYPDSWYTDITSSKRFYSLAATHQNRIVGMIVAEIRNKKTCDREDWYILSRKHPENSQITYILSLGVFKEYRRLGIASLLFDTLHSYLKSETECKAIYLHVLCCNANAIKFYEKNHFQQRIYLPNYYTIKGQLKDGFCYARYMRDGEPPWTFTYPFGKIKLNLYFVTFFFIILYSLFLSIFLFYYLI